MFESPDPPKVHRDIQAAANAALAGVPAGLAAGRAAQRVVTFGPGRLRELDSALRPGAPVSVVPGMVR